MKFSSVCLAAFSIFGLTNCATTEVPEIPVVKNTGELERSIARGKSQALKSHIVEVRRDFKADPNSYTDREIPPPCLSILRDFLDYLSADSPNIFYNKEAQRRWFSSNMQQASANYLSVYLRDSQIQEFATFPDNDVFIGAKENPQAYSIQSWRWWKNEVEIEVIFFWGQSQIDGGDVRKSRFSFIEEFDKLGNSYWRLHAIEHEESSNGLASETLVNERLWSDSYK